MIDDLAIEDDRQAAVGADDRLMAARDIDDAEPAHAEAEVAVDEMARARRGRDGSNGRHWRAIVPAADRTARASCTNRQFRT